MPDVSVLLRDAAQAGGVKAQQMSDRLGQSQFSRCPDFDVAFHNVPL